LLGVTQNLNCAKPQNVWKNKSFFWLKKGGKDSKEKVDFTKFTPFGEYLTQTHSFQTWT